MGEARDVLAAGEYSFHDFEFFDGEICSEDCDRSNLLCEVLVCRERRDDLRAMAYTEEEVAVE